MKLTSSPPRPQPVDNFIDSSPPTHLTMMESPTASNGWSHLNPPVTHRCSRLLSGYCDDPENVGVISWPCQRASCNYCVDLSWNLYCDPENICFLDTSIQTTFQGITGSAERGCQTCSLLCEGLTAVTRSLNDQDAYDGEMLAISHLEIHIRNHGSILVQVYHKLDMITCCLEVEFYADRDEDKQCLIPSIGYAEHVPSRLDITALTAFTKKHMAECMKHHLICSATERKVYPSRIIDVGLDVTQQDVVLTTLEDSNPQYIALSHCWGSTSEMFTTTRETLAERYRNIPFSQLPKTFQDAVQITRALSFRYLWIDSLCIIQDDTTDWELASAKMAGIYEESCLTIAATASVDSKGGFFFNRWTRQPSGRRSNIETFEFQRTFGDGDRTVYVRQAFESGHFTIAGTPQYPKFPADTAPLLHRAWAYQERILAPRILHVNTDEMFWECKHCTLCECGYLSWDRKQSDLEHLNRQGPLVARPSSTSKSRIARAVDQATPIENVRSIWQHILKDYTTLALTNESDRLPALSGLASFLSQRFETRYLAGLWEDNLAVELLWQRERSTTQGLCSRNTTSNMPSWSWASIARSHSGADNINRHNHMCNVPAFGGLIEDPRLKILHADCRVVGANPFGEVSGGTISISGALINVKLHLKRESTWERSQVVFKFKSKSGPGPGSESNDVQLDILGPDEPVEVSDGEMLSCILFGKEGLEYYNRGIALVLKAVGADTYRRVGVLNLDAKNIRWWDGVMPVNVYIV